MPFIEILGQDQPLGQLSRAFVTGRLAHAYLFEGPDGVGKSMSARALARILLCPRKGEKCKCETCQLVLEDRHPLVRTYGLAKNSRNIGVDAIRDDLIPFFNLKSAPGEYKMAIIDPADALSPEAANMLLKTLEEPGEWSLLVLLTRTAQALLPTIRSRCQCVRFGRIPEPLIADRLMAKMDITREHARVVAKLSCGSVGRALELAGKDFSAWRVRALDAYAELLASEAGPVETAAKFLEIAGKSAKGLQERRVELQHLLGILLTYLRDLVIAREKYEGFLLHEDRPTLAQEAALLDEEQALAVFDRIIEAKDDIDRNVNMQIALEELCLDTSAIAGGAAGTSDRAAWNPHAAREPAKSKRLSTPEAGSWRAGND